MKKQQPENRECRALIAWADLQPEIGYYLFHIPNGGSRHPLEAANLKRMGVRAGVSDYFFRRQRGKFGGLWIEMKYGKGKLTTTQKEFGESCIKEGYMFVTCWSWEDAMKEIETYMKLK